MKDAEKKKKQQAKGKTIPPLNLPCRHPSHPSLPPSPPLCRCPLATFICCPINNCYCGFNYAPVISESGGHMSSLSRGSPANYRHPSEGPRRCSSVAVAIITAPLQTSVLWTASPSGLSLSHRALLCQARPLTSHLSPAGDNWFARSSREEAEDNQYAKGHLANEKNQSVSNTCGSVFYSKSFSFFKSCLFFSRSQVYAASKVTPMHATDALHGLSCFLMLLCWHWWSQQILT